VLAVCHEQFSTELRHDRGSLFTRPARSSAISRAEVTDAFCESVAEVTSGRRQVLTLSPHDPPSSVQMIKSMSRMNTVNTLTLWRPLLPYGYSYYSILCQTGLSRHLLFWHPDTLTLSPERQSARMSKITNDGLTRSGTWCFIAAQYGNSGCQRAKS